MRQMNVVGKPYEGEPHVRFEVAGVGDGSFDTAPAPDPTYSPELIPGSEFMR